MDKSERARGFIRDYKKICVKYGIYVSACGCCDSPWMNGVSKPKEIKRHIKHLVELMQYTL